MTDIYELSSAIVDEQVEASPLLATFLGLPGYDHLWDDFSVDGRRAAADLLRDQLARVQALPVTGDRWAALGTRVAAEALEDRLAWHDADEAFRDLNSIDSPLQHVREVFDHMAKDGAEAWGNITGRLEGLGTALAGYRELLEAGRSRGMAVARRQVIEGARQARNFAGDGSPFVDLAAAPDLAAVGDDALASRVADGAAAARAAYADLADYLESVYLPSAVESDAVGEERYVSLARQFLGEEIDPHAAYEWGWDEIARLRARMDAVGEEILPGAPLAEVLSLLQTDPERAAHSQDEFRDLMQERLQEALDDLDGVHFDVPEQIRRVDVKMAPPGGSLGAYYVSPSEDFSRAGSVWWSKGNKQIIPLFDEVSTAYHEGFPGHHLQNGLQMTAGDRITRLQKLLIWYSGSGEGWALYAEDLMDELGYLEKPDYVMGKLASEMLRACRVAIDIGSHLELPIPGGQPFHPGERWTFETGVEMLDDYAAQDHDISVSEINRYLGWPGQAISYKVGQQAIRDLRAEAQQDLGPAFDLKAFHARLLEIGAPGLSVVREHMRGEGPVVGGQ
jgi:uncharacterized protein (DUF885 family)